MQKFEYKFVRLGEGWLSATREARDGYQDVIQEHAREGWRLVQVFAPIHWGSNYYEIILEKEIRGAAV